MAVDFRKARFTAQLAEMLTVNGDILNLCEAYQQMEACLRYEVEGRPDPRTALILGEGFRRVAPEKAE